MRLHSSSELSARPAGTLAEQSGAITLRSARSDAFFLHFITKAAEPSA